jgi:hypothetical protein
MSEEKDVTFTAEEICQQAQVNANFLSLGTILYLKERTLSIDGYWAFMGGVAAPSWTQGLTAKELATGAARNCVSFGGELRSVSGDETRAEAVVAGWPSEEDLKFYDLTQKEADAMWVCLEHIAIALGYRFEWRRQGDEVTMTFWR